ncbi:ABC transporter substrate-binding protein [Alkalibaculum bacchi]|uniref:ABC transporter substrate-binding protein n=1 Tax=Alkalibaculum bacchi TaxID=645887 RepID=UPI0026E9D53D|nr:ABC transporter substrate-binding protein [Alkalibaculum bacchi]
MKKMKRMGRVASLFMVLFLLLSFAVGCSQPASNTPDETGTDQQTPDTSKTVTDMSGREVTIEGEIETIGTFGAIGVLNAFVELMGDGDKIINEMSPRFTEGGKWKYQYVFAPQIADGPVFEDGSGEIQIETVLETAPDLCLTMSKDVIPLLEEKGLTVLYLEWEDLSDIEVAVNLLGDVLNRQDVAKDYLKYFDEKVAEAEELTKDLAEADKKTVLYGNVSTYTQPHIIAEWWIVAAGGISVTDNDRDSDSYEYTAEDLLAWNPDVMITTSGKMGEELKADERLKDITAIQEDVIYPVPTVAHVWGNRTVEQPLTIMWAMNKIYPEIMTTDMLKEEISYFYSHFFKTDLTDEQITEIIG